MVRLKTDFHIHTSDDRCDRIRHTETELIDAAARNGFDAIAITNHDTFTCCRDLADYALDKGMVLIPGIEKKIEGKHVLLLNAFPATEKIETFAELRSAKQDGLFVIAPHPFYLTRICLGRKLYEHLDLFDAVEFSYFYTKHLNPNKRVMQLNREKGMPVVGNSDCHSLPHLGLCHSIIEAENTSMASIFQAIRQHRVEVVSAPQTAATLAAIMGQMVANKYLGLLPPRLRRSPVSEKLRQVLA